LMSMNIPISFYISNRNLTSECAAGLRSFEETRSGLPEKRSRLLFTSLRRWYGMKD
jgi:hypothetical protein